MEFKYDKFLVGWDTAPPKGDRCSLVIGLTPEQHAASMRANIPPGDEEGAQILRDIKVLTDEFESRYPKAVTFVFVFNQGRVTAVCDTPEQPAPPIMRLGSLIRAAPAACPWCKGSDITYIVNWTGLVSSEDPDNIANLDEYQCRTCDGRSFWV